MENSFANPIIDPVLTGYTKYSRFRIGNIISINGIYKGVGIIVIGQILALDHDGDPTFFEIKNLSNGSSGFVKPSAPGGPFGSSILYPENLNFRRDPNNRHSYSDGVTILSGYGAQNFKVTDAVSGRVVYEEKEIYDILSERSRVLGIEHVHELQNLYADEFPDKTLDLSHYIDRSLNVLAKSKERIDAGQKTW